MAIVVPPNALPEGARTEVTGLQVEPMNIEPNVAHLVQTIGKAYAYEFQQLKVRKMERIGTQVRIAEEVVMPYSRYESFVRDETIKYIKDMINRLYRQEPVVCIELAVQVYAAIHAVTADSVRLDVTQLIKDYVRDSGIG